MRVFSWAPSIEIQVWLEFFFYYVGSVCISELYICDEFYSYKVTTELTLTNEVSRFEDHI